jgi:CheY-like chemotaxis protein
VKHDAAGDPKQKNGPRFLVVEDEAMIAMYVEDLLLSLDCRVMKAGRVERALELVGENEFDGAFLDINVFGTPTFSLANELRKREIPFAFITGYNADYLPLEYKDCPVLTKPIVEHKFTELVATFAAHACNKHALKCAEKHAPIK